ncbi:MAG TPA: DUF5947 family protein [Terracidiphilus sp.]
MQNEKLHERQVSREALSALKQFAQPVAPAERCELCGRALGDEHPHLLETPSRRIHCSCDACAILFSGQEGIQASPRSGSAVGAKRYLRIPRQVRPLEDFSLSDFEWEELAIPIRLAFFFRTEDGGLAAMYPSPGGAIESQLSFGSLHARFDEHRELRRLRPLVEALLVSRVGDRHAYLIAPIDECFRLVGLIRTRWRGLSGGTEVWGAIAAFLDDAQRWKRSVQADPGGSPNAICRQGTMDVDQAPP